MSHLSLAYNIALFVVVVTAWFAIRWSKLPSRAFLVATPVVGVAALALAALNPWGRYAFVRLVCWGLFLHWPLFLIGASILVRKQHPVLSTLRIIIASAVLLVGLDAFVVEPHWLRVTHVTIRTDKITHPARIALLADIQTDEPGGYELRALRVAMAEKPDLVLFAGDYTQTRNENEYLAAAAALNRVFGEADLSAPLGLFAAQGNMDWRPWEPIFEGTPVKCVRRTQSVDLGEIDLTLLSEYDSRFYSSGPKLNMPAGGKFHIVLGHRPDFSLGQVDADLLLAGHTHGGQVQLPIIGPLVTLSRVPRSWAHGVTRITPEKTLIVSRGIGMERDQAPRLRFLCRPEIVIIDLVPAAGQQ